MGWLSAARGEGSAAKSQITELGAQVAQQYPMLPILLFALDSEIDPHLLQVRLAARLAELGIKTKVSVAGPGRVQAVMDGSLTPEGQVLLVLASSSADTEDRLMDLVEWLIANGREELAQQMIFIPVGTPRKSVSSYPFRHVPLVKLESALNSRGGTSNSRRTTANSTEPLLTAVLAQALGLE